MKLRVLIVEDELLVAFAMRQQVECCGCQVMAIARNGAEALDRCRRERPDVTLMDVRMPEMDGITATRWLMAECPHPIIMVTANIGYEVQAEHAGAMACVGKPLITEEFSRVLEVARARFARFLRVREESASGAEALAAWHVVGAAVRALAQREGLCEGTAFERLRGAADRRGIPLVSAAREVLRD